VGLVEEAGSEGLFVPGELRYSEQVQHIVDQAIDRFGRIDVLVNNASILFSDAAAGATYEPITAVTDEAWDALVDTNLKGVFLMCREVIPRMIAQGGGNIINIGSNSAVLGHPLVHCYSAAKAGVASLTRSIAATYTGQGIRANSIAAGIFDLPMAAGTITPFVSQVGHLFNPMSRLGTMEEIANPLLFLASDESSFVHGVDLVVDGGQAIAALPPIKPRRGQGGRMTVDPSVLASALDAEKLMAAARTQAGLEDFGDDSFVEPLRRFADAIAREGRLNELGVMAITGDATRFLVNRVATPSGSSPAAISDRLGTRRRPVWSRSRRSR
jgi:NAD(P)-dependent dehydrogenase (short-subunit alcohol dehydrogenase family)